MPHTKRLTLALLLAVLSLGGCVSIDRDADGYAMLAIDTHKKRVTLGEDGFKIWRYDCNPRWRSCGSGR